ncbi:Transposase IS4 [Popillia japonica]|uniref:Transposase IS4 n=1 Tax=Popillia japonica TaxID=7064 RepID=A0AAW1ISF0_POPJA
MQVYTGKLPDGVTEKNQGQGITTDNFFTNVELAEYLITKKLTLLGTVRKNKADTPHELKDITMVSYTPKKNRMVHLLSTQHFDNSISDEPHSKPIIVLDYNHTKGAVDTADKLIIAVKEYSCARRTLRWLFRLFMNILDIAALNAHIIFREKNPQWQLSKKSRRKLFLLTLGRQLEEPNMKDRLPNAKTIPHLQRALVACGIQIPTKEQPHSELETRFKRGRCILCSRAADKKSKVRCSIYSNFVCNEHRKEEKKIICLRRNDKDDSDD